MDNGDSPYILNSRTATTDRAADGAIEGTKGNLTIANPLLPTGTNKCIGAGEDKENGRIFYFIHNSNSNHAIFQYDQDTQTVEKILINSLLNFSLDHYINHVDFVEDLMYWTDGYNPPRKINVEKANNTDKFLSQNVYFLNSQIIDGYDKTLSYEVLLTTQSGFSTLITLVNPNASAILAIGGRAGQASVPATLQDVSQLFESLWNNNSILYSYYEASSCNGFVTLTAKDVNQEDFIAVMPTTTVETLNLKVVAANYYPSGTKFREDFINRVKYPFECQPDVEVDQDSTRITNLIQNKVFQFRTQIIYDDNEPSALSPISIIPTVPGFCGQDSTQSIYNVINVVFDIDRMNDVNVLSIIKYVNIYVRSGNLGKFGFVVSLTREQFIATVNSFAFYNDGVYPEISDTLSNKLFDSVPLTCQSQVLAENRIFDGGILEGYDPICLDNKLTLTYDENVKQDTFSIKGRAAIRNFFGNGNFALNQPITSHDQGSSGTDWGFGGVGPELFVGGDIIWSNYSTYKQTIPLKGFVFYLVGTNYKAVTYQMEGSVSASYYPFPTGGGSSNEGKRRVASSAVAGGNIYQHFEIKNVPPGKYILRIASHLTTQAELDSDDLTWQRSSTNCLAVGGVGGSECLLEVLSNGNIVIGGVTYPVGGSIPESAIADLTHVGPLNIANVLDSFVVCGYLCDQDTSNTGVNILKDTRIELAAVQMSHYNPSQYNSIPAAYGLPFIFSGGVITDHNGYFFYTTNRPSVVFPTTLNLISGTSVNVNLILMDPSKLKIDGSAWTGRLTPGADIGIFRNTLASIQVNGRTILNGTVESDGIPIPGVVVMTTRGRYVTTDLSGEYSIYIYGRNGSRADTIIYGLEDDCFGEFTPYSDYYNVSINGIGPYNSSTPSPYSGTYNAANTVETIGSELLILNSGAIPSLKRGGRYRFGRVYYDYANRSTTTLTDEDLNLSIPFYTQLGGSSIIGKGRPLVDWDIYNLPPDWATHYQWVRTINGNQQKLLQWAAKTVVYIDDAGSTVSYLSATQIKIDLDNITDYSDIHPDSNVSYTFEDGDRLVLIKDAQGNFFDNYYDFKITGVKSGALLTIYIENNTAPGLLTDGVFFEIYNSQKTVSQEIFYEIGECFGISENQNGVKIHEGPSVNQEYWTFDDNFYDSATAKLGFVNATLNHDFQIGDTIVISQNPGYTNGEYNTKATIIAITSTSVAGFVIVTNQPFLIATPPEGGNIVRAAHGRFSTGDTWNRLRIIPITSTTNNIVFVEDYSISDFYDSLDQSIGRPNAINREVAQLFRQSTIRFSNNYIQDTKINGLSSNESLNFKALPANYGTIKKLVFTKTTLLAIHENSQIVSMEVGKQTLRDTGNQQLVAVSNQVLPTDYEYQGSLGTQNPESIVKDDNDMVYGIDVNKGIAWVRQVNGLVPISEIKMATFFRDKCEAMRESGSAVRIPAVYDRGYDQIIFSFNASGSVEGESVAFTIIEKYWESFYSFIPEFWCKGRNNEVFAFLDGQIWKQNVNPLYNNFFGVQYTQKLMAVGNVSGSTMKVWLNVSLEGTSTDVWSAPSITTLEGQTSELANGDFELIENVWYADLLRDSSTPNVANPLIFGDDLRSSALKVMFENTSTEYSLLFGINLYAISSEKTNRS